MTEKIHGQMNREWNGTKLSNSRREKADYETAYQYRGGGIIVRIEHVALYVNDLENTKKFFMKYFSAKSDDGYHNQKTGFCSYFECKVHLSGHSHDHI